MDTPEQESPWRFEAPLDRRALRVRTMFAVLAASLLCSAGAGALENGAIVGGFVGMAGAVVFGSLGYASFCMSRIEGSPLVLDERGLSFDDGLGPRSFVAWERVSDVALRKGTLARRVVVVAADGDREQEYLLPPICYAGAPVEWTAGLIETFRHHAIHR